MAFCHRCGKELPAGAAFCHACGAPVVDSAPFASSTGSMGPSQVTVGGLSYASVGYRFVAVLIDHVLLAFASLVILVPAFIVGAIGLAIGLPLFFGPVFLLSALLWLLYFSYFEGTSGQTFGKSLLGIKVVDATTQRPVDIGRALIRNILRIIDWFPFFYLIGFILVETDFKKRRLGDMAASTVVVKV